MIKLAQDSQDNKASVSLASIAEEEKISLSYLERLFAMLKKADLVVSEKGANGGYRLARKSSEINLFDIVRTLEGDLNPFHCVDEGGKIFCDKNCKCGATSVFVKVQTAVFKTLHSIKLSELL
jgi:Rrf2 family protein